MVNPFPDMALRLAFIPVVTPPDFHITATEDKEKAKTLDSSPTFLIGDPVIFVWNDGKGVGEDRKAESDPHPGPLPGGEGGKSKGGELTKYANVSWRRRRG